MPGQEGGGKLTLSQKPAGPEVSSEPASAFLALLSGCLGNVTCRYVRAWFASELFPVIEPSSRSFIGHVLRFATYSHLVLSCSPDR